jgi:autotransporter-associated beta strand protein
MFCAWITNAQDGYWINGQGASWASPGNWDPADGIAGGADNTAYFGFGREATIAPNASFSLDGTQTVGNLFFTLPSGPGNWSFNAGAGGSIILANNFGLPQITVTSPSLEVTLNAALAGTAGVEKKGSGTLVLGAANTYTGQTLASGGALDVNGSVATGVEVTNAILSGTGAIAGPVVVDAGGTLSLGNSPAPLTINNSLVLLPGSTTLAAIGALTGQPLVQGLSHITYGGTLVLTNLPAGLSIGQGFALFGNVPASGNFSGIMPPPGPWMRWRFDPATGGITVVSSASQPAFTSVNFGAGKMSSQVAGGPPGSPCYVLVSTNLGLPLSAWTRVATNMFDVSGNCTLEIGPGENGAGQFYMTTFIIPAP